MQDKVLELELQFPSIKNNLLYSRWGIISCLSSFLSLCFFICPNMWPYIVSLCCLRFIHSIWNGHFTLYITAAKSCELLGCCVLPENCICSLPSCVTAYLPTFTCLVDEVFIDFLLPIDMTCLHSINVLAVLLVLMVIVTNIYFSLHMDAPYISPFFYRMKLQHTIYVFLLFF